MTTLIDHARNELNLLGESERNISAYIDVLQALSDINQLGISPEEAMSTVTKLLYFKNVTPLTANPDEWVEVGKNTGMPNNLWQSKRDPEAFSMDGGRTYYILSERDIDPNSIHVSLPRSLDD